MMGALVLYFFANQTQVGWIYVMAALLAGLVPAAWWVSRGALRGLSAARRVALSQPAHGDRAPAHTTAQALHEGDCVDITLHVRAARTAAQLHFTEQCVLAAPDSALRTQPVYVPALPRHQAVDLSYSVELDRRGVHRFAPLLIESCAPFGLFRCRGALDAPLSVLVYPQVRPLKRLALLDRQLAPQTPRPQPGHGFEVIGARPYRPGDSPRHIHWRSSARAGTLISKEFADEAQPGLTLALDLYAHAPAPGESKHTPFEYAVKVAASIGAYAQRMGYPLHLAVDEQALPSPSGAVAWEALLEYLAKVEPLGSRRLADVLGARAAQAYVVAILPEPDSSVMPALAALRGRGARVLAILLDPSTFPGGGTPAAAEQQRLRAAGFDARLIAFGEDWTHSLGDSPEPDVAAPFSRHTTYARVMNRLESGGSGPSR
jgi:uncharacterized protein (DUF58 family)